MFFCLIFRSPMIHQSLDLMKLGNVYESLAAWLLGFIFIQLSTMVGTPPWLVPSFGDDDDGYGMIMIRYH